MQKKMSLIVVVGVEGLMTINNDIPTQATLKYVLKVFYEVYPLKFFGCFLPIPQFNNAHKWLEIFTLIGYYRKNPPSKHAQRLGK